MPAVLDYQHVEISYSGRAVVRDVSFQLQEGEILGLAGESGSGKSSLIKAAMGLLGTNGLVTRGDIWFEGKNLPDLSEKELRPICGAKIGMIFQDSGGSLCPIRTIGEQIVEGMQAHRKLSIQEIKRRALELFEKLEFPDGRRIWKSYPFELSGGMNQRAGIAMAMLMNPAILLADEPTSALDVAVQKQVVGEMLRIREIFGTAIIIVSHDFGVISAMADRILILKNGRMVEYGRTREILSHPRDPYTRELLEAVPRIRRAKSLKKRAVVREKNHETETRTGE